jgi:hypothetical protein
VSKAVVIGTYSGREEWLANCLKTLASYKNHTIIVCNAPWELGVIKWVYDNTRLEEFIFLHDTVEVKTYDWIEEAFACPFSVALTNKPCMFGMYMGKYQRRVLKHLPIPSVTSKRESVYHESHWTNEYFKIDPAAKVLWPELDDHPYRVVEAFGRPNLILENEHFAKYKGTWNIDQAEEIDRKAGIIKI